MDLFVYAIRDLPLRNGQLNKLHTLATSKSSVLVWTEPTANGSKNRKIYAAIECCDSFFFFFPPNQQFGD